MRVMIGGAREAGIGDLNEGRLRKGLKGLRTPSFVAWNGVD